MGMLIGELEEYRQTLMKERERQAKIKEKYGVKSLEHLIWMLDRDLIGLYERRDKGEKVDLVIFNKEEQKTSYEKALEDLHTNLARERNLTISMPRFLCAVRVVPGQFYDDEMQSSAEIEKIGMDETMKYERQNDREPEDVATLNLGFDVRSTDPNTGQKRYIEVKARAGVGAVALTQNEWFKAQRFGDDYFLYVVLNAATEPESHIVKNPYEVLQPD